MKCLVCGRAIRRPGEKKMDHPNTLASSVLGLCVQDYHRIRSGEIEDPRTERSRRGPRPKAEVPAALEGVVGADGLVWREDLSQMELDAAETVVDALRGDNAALLEVAGALGFRNADGLADLTTQSSNPARPLKL